MLVDTFDSLILLYEFLPVQLKQSNFRPGQALRFQEVEAPIFQDIRHMKVIKLWALRTGRLYPQVIFPMIISVRGWVNPGVMNSYLWYWAKFILYFIYILYFVNLYLCDFYYGNVFL